MGSLYVMLGGDHGIEELVESLYARILSDYELAPFFEGVDMKLQRQKFRSFLHMVSGGPQSRTGIELRAAHFRVVDRGLNEAHLESFSEYFRQALEDAHVPDHAIDEIMQRIASSRNDVLGQ